MMITGWVSLSMIASTETKQVRSPTRMHTGNASAFVRGLIGFHLRCAVSAISVCAMYRDRLDDSWAEYNRKVHGNTGTTEAEDPGGQREVDWNLWRTGRAVCDNGNHFIHFFIVILQC